jgi:CRP-like cAMP-binding protein
MSKANRYDYLHKNFILASLPEEELENLTPAMQIANMTPEDLIYRTNQTVEFVYFPTTAMLSWIATTSEGERVEVGVVGWEGMVGVPEMLGYKVAPFTVEVELPGEVVRIRADVFRRSFERLDSIQKLLFRYTYTAHTQLAQSSVCNRFHTVEERMNRWLLMAHDRCETDELMLTQEILAGMIGARRPAVSIVLGNLQKAGLIKIERGKITILDREGMEKSACECYRVIREAFDRFVGSNQTGESYKSSGK